MKRAGKSPKAIVKSGDARRDRKSGTGMNGSPKKGGNGGKFTWSGDGFSHAELGFGKETVDSKDPNYEDSEDIVNNA